MTTRTLNRTDLIAGGLLAVVGLFAVAQGLAYDIGTVRRMGPGFFPVVVGLVLVLAGIAIALIDGRRATELQAPRHNFRALILITTAMAAFALLIRPAGMVPAVCAAVFLASLADPGMKPGTAALVAVAMSVLSVIVFIWGLGFQAAPFGAY